MTLKLASPFAAFVGTTVLPLVIPGCLPLPESVGQGLSTGESDASTGESDASTGGISSGEATSEESTDGSADGSSGEPVPELEWELELDFRTACHDARPMPDGGVAILTEHYDTNDKRLRRYAADGTLLWEGLEGVESWALDVLPDGRLVVGGFWGEEVQRAALWMVSPEGEIQATYVPPAPELPDDDTWVVDVDANPTGVAFVVEYSRATWPDAFGPPTLDRELTFAGLDLQPIWSKQYSLFWSSTDRYRLEYVELAASGSIRTLEIGNPPQLRSYSPTGELEVAIDLPEEIDHAEFVHGDPGVVKGSTDDGYRFIGLEERPGLDVFVDVAGLGADGPHNTFMKAYHQDGGLVLSHTAETFSQIWTSALDVDGEMIYGHPLESTVGPVITVFDIVAGPAGSVYFCGYDRLSSGPGGNGFLLRRDPQG